jgi:hypothetical protein
MRGGRKRSKSAKRTKQGMGDFSFLGSINLAGNKGLHSLRRLGKRSMKYGRSIRKSTFGWR